MKLSELIDFNPRTPLPREAEIPFIDMAMLPTAGRDVSENGWRQPSSSGSKFRNGDTLLARITPCLENGKGAKVSGLPGEGFGQGSTEFIVMRAKRRSDENFVYYLSREPNFRSFAIQQMSGTSGRQRVNWQSLAEFEIEDVAVADRQAGGLVLAALDDKIELNRRMNETLEAMVQTIFRDWFVDFGPVRRAQDGASDPIAILGGLISDPIRAAEIAALFPATLGNDGLPDGWAPSPLIQNVSELRRGISPRYLESGGVAVINQKCVRDHRINLNVARRHDPMAKNIAGREVRAGDVLVNSTGVGTLGRVAQIWQVDEPTTADGHVTIVRADENRLGPCLLGAWMFQLEYQIQALGEGSTGQTELSRAALGELPIITSNSEIEAYFEHLVCPIKDRELSAENESRTLAETRDFLLPRLMSGKVRVADAERLLG